VLADERITDCTNGFTVTVVVDELSPGAVAVSTTGVSLATSSGAVMEKIWVPAPAGSVIVADVAPLTSTWVPSAEVRVTDPPAKLAGTATVAGKEIPTPPARAGPPVIESREVDSIAVGGEKVSSQALPERLTAP
jgi:hypothetical protein